MHPLYGTWASMKHRCYNPKNKHYNRYGGRGITVSDSWLHSFNRFVTDMGPKPSPDYTLDRINNDGNYSSENCRWASKKTQMNNYSDNHLIEYKNETHTLSQWASITGINGHLIRAHLVDAATTWTVGQALGFESPPFQRKGRFAVKCLTYNNETKTYIQWSIERNIPAPKIKKRIQLNWTPGQALEFELAPKINRNRDYSKRYRATIHGQNKSLKTWCRIAKLNYAKLLELARNDEPFEPIIIEKLANIAVDYYHSAG